MSIVDNYSLYRKKAGKKHTFILEKCSEHYEPLHKPGKRAPSEIPLYITAVPDAVHSHSARKPALSLGGAGSTYFSGLYIADPKRPEIAFGDLGADALLCIIGEEQAEVFVCKGKKNVSFQIVSMFADGDPDLLAEVEIYRKGRAK